jgi:DNA-directed RNA polymerase subunit RPC12/RpoP
VHWYAWVLGPPETVVGFLVTYPRFWKWVAGRHRSAPPPTWPAVSGTSGCTVDLRPKQMPLYRCKDCGKTTTATMRCPECRHKIRLRAESQVQQLTCSCCLTLTMSLHGEDDGHYYCTTCGRAQKRCADCGEMTDPALMASDICISCVNRRLPAKRDAYERSIKADYEALMLTTKLVQQGIITTSQALAHHSVLGWQFHPDM